jgi:uncharacterized membrane protein YfcA
MEYIVICSVAFLASALTLFSGFGLGTILTPVFAIFFPIDIAIALTAIVHFLNGVFKFILVGKKIDKSVFIKFGVPSIIASFLGAFALIYLSDSGALYSYSIGEKHFEISSIKLLIGFLLIFFVLMDFLPALAKIEFDKKYLPLGGFLSGFFGGLSGNQGALRSAFLIKAGLSKESFIATGVAIACCIDVTRLSVYASKISAVHNQLNYSIVVAATFAAFTGAFLGIKLIKKVTITFIQNIVAIMLLLFALLLISGIL